MVPAPSSEDYFRGILDSLLEGCQIIGFDWRYLYVNETLARHGYSDREKLLGQRIMDAYPGIEETRVFKVMDECMQERKPARIQNEFVFPNGALGWFELSIQPVPDGIFVLSLDITEQKRTEETSKTQLRRLASLRSIDLAILGTTDIRLALKTIVEETQAGLQADIVQIELLNPKTLMLKTVAVLGNRFQDIEHSSRRLGEGISGRAALDRRTVIIHDLGEVELPNPIREAILREQVSAVYSTPLIAKGTLIGSLSVFMRNPFEAPPDWIAYLETLAGQAAMAIESGQASENLQRANVDLLLAYDVTIEGWARALDLRDKETEGHSRRVTEMSVELAERAGMSEEEIMHVRRGALLHDIGKMGVPDSILLKPGKLTEEEWTIMRKHPTFAYEFLSPIPYLVPAIAIPHYHHEKWDGSGYPQGLKGEAIPLPARLFAIVDVYDALSSDRPYRPRWPKEKILAHIAEGSGTHFDPKVVKMFLKFIEQDGNG